MGFHDFQFQICRAQQRFAFAFIFLSPPPLFSVVDSHANVQPRWLCPLLLLPTLFSTSYNHMVINLKYWLRWFFFNWMSFVFIRSKSVFPFRLQLLDAIPSTFCNPLREKCELQHCSANKWKAMGRNVFLNHYKFITCYCHVRWVHNISASCSFSNRICSVGWRESWAIRAIRNPDSP